MKLLTGKTHTLGGMTLAAGLLITYTPSVNIWNNYKSLQIIINNYNFS